MVVLSCANRREGSFEAVFKDPTRFALSLATTKELFSHYTCHQVGLYTGAPEYALIKSYRSTLAFVTDMLAKRRLPLHAHLNMATVLAETPSQVKDGFRHAVHHCQAILDPGLDPNYYSPVINRVGALLHKIYTQGGHGVEINLAEARHYETDTLNSALQELNRKSPDEKKARNLLKQASGSPLYAESDTARRALLYRGIMAFKEAVLERDPKNEKYAHAAYCLLQALTSDSLDDTERSTATMVLKRIYQN